MATQRSISSYAPSGRALIAWNGERWYIKRHTIGDHEGAAIRAVAYLNLRRDPR